ncbi:MAG: DNA methyltransferase, partial [Coriobacteriales bacterium]
MKRWQEAEGNEDREARSFWIELYQNVLGIQQPTQVLDFERRIAGRKCDVFHEDQRLLVEMKSRGVSLDESSVRSKKAGEETPYEQALWYYNHLGTLSKPYWLITCNFDELRIYDMRDEIPDEGTYVSLKLEDLPEKAHLLGFITDTSSSRLQVEQELSVKAAELVGKLYDGFSKQYANLDTSEEEQHSLNVLIVRLVFLLYAEDAGLLQEHQAFLHYLQRFEVKDMRRALIDLFEVLNTPDAERDPYMDEDLAAFPYVNGGLFEGRIIIPQFTLDLRVCLLAQASAGFDWKGISPTIFGAAFESTLNPETRRSGGMHYTSIENIHKVIDPLFLDDLKAELAQIEGEKVEKTRRMRLKLFQRKLAGINILDPACGSGNFLTESYICLRHLENRVLADLLDESQIGMDLGDGDGQIMVNINQLYGIEINDFAVSVAKTALWIAESQAMEETQDILFKPFEFLPLKSVNNLHCGNALRMDWNDVLPAEECSYCLGNPPFKGAHAKPPRTSEQTNELKDASENGKGVGDADYVAAWFALAARYLDESGTPCAFVATSSITQGQQPALIWNYLYNHKMSIEFAYRPFLWKSEANDPAAVAVTVIGFSSNAASKGKTLFETDYKTGSVLAPKSVSNINPYLYEGPSTLVTSRTKPLLSAPSIGIGNKPIDGGYYLFKEDEKRSFVSAEPAAERFFHRWMGATEFINGKDRYVLWLGDTSDSDLDD